jgi:superfamily II DNA or RNA helicase
MTKSEIQLNCVNLSKTYNNLLLAHCTSLGKTKSALDIVSQLPGNGFIVLAEKAHIKNWKEEIIKFNYQDIFNRSEVFLYASLHKYKNREVDWIIFDECHHISSLRRDSISTIKSNNNILLSATITNNQLFDLTQIFPKLKRDYISLNKAIDWGVIPIPEINLVPIELDNIKLEEIIIFKKGKGKNYITQTCYYKERWEFWNKFKLSNNEIIIKCNQLEKYEWLTESMEYWKNLYFRNRLPYQKIKWLQLGSQRKRFLAEIKTKHSLDLINKIQLESKRFICFAGSINQCNILGSEFNIVHSKNKNNQEVIDSFNSNKINSLFAVDMLKEGMNLYDIEIGLIIQLDGNLRSYIQKAGRVFRSNNPIQYIIYVKDTRDEEYLNNALKGLEKYIKK